MRSTIVHLACMNNLDPGYREAVAVLDGTVVVNGHGAGAMATLTGFVHDEAARSGSSRSDRWLHALTQARMPLGPAVASTTRVTALQVADYRAALSRGLDQLPLNFLGVTAEPIHVENLLDRFRVQLPGTERDGRAETATLGHVARRWPGLCVVGAAGAGKSTALAQLVAAWAVDVDAPLPIHVPMYRLVPPLRDHEPLGLAEIVRLGLGVRDDLAPLLVARLRDGGAALVLDGLDECRDQQDAAVDLIHQLLADLPYSAGLVISARDAVSFKAFATGLPVTVLQEPRDAGAVASMIVAHVMKAAWPNHTPADLASARNWMRQSQSDHPGLWKIPLFATLLAAHAGRATSGVLPTSRAEALVAAITDSVKAWEVTKQWEPRSWQPALSPDQLLDGFIALGHTTASGSASRADAAKAVTDILHVRWDMSAGAASESAEEILAWWVGRVGAFTDQDGDLRPALRLLGEVADAMWASGQPADEAAAWMIKAVQDPTQFRESILLAASLSSALRETLMAEATEAEAVLLAAGAILLGLSASDEEVTRIAERLFELSDDPVTNKEHDRSVLGAINLHQDQRDGPTWKFLLALAKLPPRGGVATVQTRALGTLPEGERRLVLGALTTAASCRFEQRELDDHERMVLQALLNLPAPTKEPEPVRPSRRRFLTLNSTQRLVSGHMEAVIAAVEMMGLTQEQAESA